MPVNVFHDYDRIIDDQSNRNRQSSQGHQVQRSTKQLYEKESPDDGEWKTDRRDNGDACVPQKYKQDHDSKDRSDQNGIADACH